MATAAAFVTNPLMNLVSIKKSSNDTINVAVIVSRSRGRDYYRALVKIPNVKIAKTETERIYRGKLIKNIIKKLSTFI